MLVCSLCSIYISKELINDFLSYSSTSRFSILITPPPPPDSDYLLQISNEFINDRNFYVKIKYLKILYKHFKLVILLSFRQTDEWTSRVK